MRSKQYNFSTMKSRTAHYSFVQNERSPGNTRWKLFSRWVRYRKWSVLLFIGIIIVFGYILFYGLPRKMRVLVSMEGKMERRGLSIKGTSFLLDGRPFRILSGSIHYFRVPRAYWRDRLSKLKAVGLNTVDTYVAWNAHEEERGQYDFSGNLDIVEYLSIAKELGLKVILRPGPYICAEWDWGGLPPWLLTEPDMKIRSTQSGYQRAVEQFFDALFSRIEQFQYTRGGPIIAVQIENEFGSYGDDKPYLNWLKALLKKVGVVEFLFTSDGPEELGRGSVPGTYATVNFNWKTDEAMQALEKFQPNAPLMAGEFWPGWFDHWSEKHHVMPAHDMAYRMEPMLKRGASFNLYMFHGGTNFGFMNGANLVFPDAKRNAPNGVLDRLWNRLNKIWSSNDSSQFAIYQPTVTSYDYDAPLNECGGKTAKYEQLRRIIERYSLDKESKPSPDPWANSRSPSAYGEFNVQGFLLLTDALEMLQPLPIELQRPMFVEKVTTDGAHRLYYGFVAYRTTIMWDSVKKMTISGVLGDRMLVILNGKTIAVMESNLHQAPIQRDIDVASFASASGLNEQKRTKGHDLILLVENMGRANYVRRPHTLDNMYKGFNGTVTLENPDGPIALDNWKIYGVRFKKPVEMQKFVISATAKSLWRSPEQPTPVEQPAFYRAEFDVPSSETDYPDDTFVSTEDWGKGVVYANGVNLGRYWEVGPQRTMYLPGPWLKKGVKNELIFFELHKPATKMKLQAKPELGPPCPLPCYV